MILQVLFIVFMAIWGLASFPAASGFPYVVHGRAVLAWFCVLILGLYLFMPALRG